MRRVPAAAGLLLLTACGHVEPGDAVGDADAAIAIGRSVCTKDLRAPPPKDSWHAVLSGDHWKVWSGGADHGYGRLQVLIAKRDGKPADCLATIG